MDEERIWLENELKKRGMTYKSLSLKLGRNPTYIQQFIKKNNPKKLSGETKKAILSIFNDDNVVILPRTPLQQERKRFIDIVLAVEDAFKEAGRDIAPENKAALIFALLKETEGLSEEEAKGKVLSYADFYLKTQGA